MTMVLYRKYRPSNFDEVVGQEHVVNTIRNAIKRGKIAHAYLFSGPRGTGKTTIARILAKTINCKNPQDGKPCNKCSVCLEINQNKFLDLVEIDAATHTQVDKIRDLIDRINFSPTSGKYKVYIIDEVHMLSKGAFNALLKTLEEPPEHAIFILATTEIHKIPATIISRCQRFDFRRLKIAEIKERLSRIAQQEGVKVEKGVFDFIAINSSGGLRDSESLFGQILSMESGKDKDITLKEVQDILAVADISVSIKMMVLMLEKKYSEAIEYVNETVDSGYDLEQFAKSLIEYARKLILIKISPEMKESFSSEMTQEQIVDLENISKKASVGKLVKIIRAFLRAKEEIKSSVIPQLPLELAIAEIDMDDEAPLTNKVSEDYNSKIKEPIKKITDKVSQSVKQSHDFLKKSIGLDSEKEGKAEEVKKEEAKEAKEEKKAEKEEAPERSVEVAGESGLTLQMVKDEWGEILEEVKPQNHSLTAVLKTCQPVCVNGNQVIVSCLYSFHKDKLQSLAHKTLVENIASTVLKTKTVFRFITKDEAEKMGYKVEDLKMVEKKQADNLVNAALEMFGGEVV